VPERFDSTIDLIARWAATVPTADVSDSALDAAVWHNLDSVGCALGGSSSGVVDKLLRLAPPSRSESGVSVLGLRSRVSPEYGTFVNSAMLRYLDYSDAYLRPGGGHPSDFIPALWALAELHGSTGAELVRGLYAAYEIFAALSDRTDMVERGWDNPYFISLAAAVGGSVMLGLDATTTAHAIALAVTPAVPLGVTRVGELSHWKGLAAGFAGATGLQAVRMAAVGLTGPSQAFEGTRGVWQLVTGKFALDGLGEPVDGLSGAERSIYKLDVASANLLPAAAVLGDLHRAGVCPADVGRIRISTYRLSWNNSGGGQGDFTEKWNPRNKETADHSFPYVCATALTYGEVRPESYTDERLTDPDIHALMTKIEVDEDPAITANWVDVPATDIEIEFLTGEIRRIRAVHALGHPSNPAGRDRLATKFRSLAEPHLGSADAARLEATLVALDSAPDTAEMMTLLRGARREGFGGPADG
jgi:2-methylcitrate dehydratase